jgi:hypothetical protein
MTKTSQRQTIKLARLPKHLRRPDLERRGPLRLEKFLNLTGRKYERCSVIGLTGFIRGYSVWLCRCNCGTQFLIRTNILQSKRVGCGCADGKFDRHGGSQSVEYRAWQSMIQRGREAVCARWHRYRNFLADVGQKPGPRYMLIRLDKARQYEPGNVQWLPTAEGSGRRRSIYITHNGRTLNISGWASELGISHQAMAKRVQRCKRYGAPLSEALTTARDEFMPAAFEKLRLSGSRRP